MKRVLLTGGFGNIGLSTLDELLSQGYYVRVFDIPNRKNLRKFRKYNANWSDKITVVWGDLRNYKEVEKAMENIGIVIHLGAIIPPISENYPDLSYNVNVLGTKNVIHAMKVKAPQAHLIYTSSFTIYGDRRENPIISVGDKFNPVTNYAKHKIECEQLIQSSNLKWTILRLTWVPSLNDLKLFQYMFDVPLETRIEICVTEDVGLSLVNAIDNSEALNKTFNVAGGKSCRTRYGDYLMKMFEIFGLGKNAIPAEAFTKQGTFGGWIKPQGSQKVLRFQRTSLNGFYNDLKNKYQKIGYLIKTVNPIAKFFIVNRSPYIKNFKRYHSIADYLKSIEV